MPQLVVANQLKAVVAQCIGCICGPVGAENVYIVINGNNAVINSGILASDFRCVNESVVNISENKSSIIIRSVVVCYNYLLNIVGIVKVNNVSALKDAVVLIASYSTVLESSTTRRQPFS